MRCNHCDVQTYHYCGPESYHSHIGQVLAALGYVGGHEARDIGVTVVLNEQDGRIRLSCRKGEHDAEAWILHSSREKEEIKNYLIHWHEQWSGAAKSPWGTLIGVRPVKLVHRLLDRNMTESEASAYLCRTYEVEAETARQLVRMAAVQRPYITGSAKDISVYIGIPYCSSHCLYCSFPSRLIGSESENFLRTFTDAVASDIADIGELCGRYGLRVRSVYVGGGTPTCLPLQLIRCLMETVRSALGTAEEWTVEAGRPDTASADMLAMLRQCGVNRISVNPQTMQQRILDAIGRRHTVEEIYGMYNLCRQLAFPVVNMDFIAGLPGQNKEDIRENMEIVCQLHPENVTIHTLALKKRSPLFRHPLRELVPQAEEVKEMVDICRSVLAGGGYEPYYMYRQKFMAASFANVGYALQGTISRYNIEMMEERQNVMAAGPGGATRFACSDGHSLEKMYMPKDPVRYVAVLKEKIKRRRRLCAIIYGGEDL